MMPPKLSCGLSLVAHGFPRLLFARDRRRRQPGRELLSAGGKLDRHIPLKLLSSTLMFLAAEGLSPAQAQTISLNAELNNPGLTIPPNFIWFSSEVIDLVNGIYSSQNPTLI